ncbi:MAG: hypothetical protein DRJ65_12010 [Acidobacteria bacterium]|nr:MAG: hypothetical protein DRJ65_12010 [Acidobacteriota bacterium]
MASKQTADRIMGLREGQVSRACRLMVLSLMRGGSPAVLERHPQRNLCRRVITDPNNHNSFYLFFFFLHPLPSELSAESSEGGWAGGRDIAHRLEGDHGEAVAVAKRPAWAKGGRAKRALLERPEIKRAAARVSGPG